MNRIISSKILKCLTKSSDEPLSFVRIFIMKELEKSNDLAVITQQDTTGMLKESEHWMAGPAVSSGYF